MAGKKKGKVSKAVRVSGVAGIIQRKKKKKKGGSLATAPVTKAQRKIDRVTCKRNRVVVSAGFEAPLDKFDFITKAPTAFSKYFHDKEVYFERMNRANSKATVLDATDKQKRRIFVDNGADVLFVAHLDTVLPPAFYGTVDVCGRPNAYVYGDKKKAIEKNDIIYASGLDDRLGFFMAMSLVYHDGLKADILLTDNEEIGQSTAGYHVPKKYNWVAEFDRAGDDVVTYGKENDSWRLALKRHFKTIGHGSFSDICSLSGKSCAVNVGTGYHGPHSPDSYMILSEYSAQKARFKLFYKEFKGTPFMFKELAKRFGNLSSGVNQFSGRHSYGGYNGGGGGRGLYPWWETQYGEGDIVDTTKIKGSVNTNLKCEVCTETASDVETVHGRDVCSGCLNAMVDSFVGYGSFTEGL